jgi:hypothetical protein
VSRRQYVWTERGLSATSANGVDLQEVTDALYAPDGMRLERVLGDLLIIVIGMASTGRVIAVFCERIAGQRTVFKILAARALAGEALDEWRRRLR